MPLSRPSGKRGPSCESAPGAPFNLLYSPKCPSHVACRHDHPKPTFAYLVTQIRDSHSELAYLHVVEPRVDGGEIMEIKDGYSNRDVCPHLQWWLLLPGDGAPCPLGEGRHDRVRSLIPR
ncbi:hypothetical protein B0H11DRAFT_25140 [Mycena galericulata]|nr:hypothetical protein B0H11DRAFT_25140 [Mycena galericulata]